jgi:hypothetical protein
MVFRHLLKIPLKAPLKKYPSEAAIVVSMDSVSQKVPCAGAKIPFFHRRCKRIGLSGTDLSQRSLLHTVKLKNG